MNRHRPGRAWLACSLTLCGSAALAQPGPGGPGADACREGPPLSGDEKFNFRISDAQQAFNRSLQGDLVVGHIEYIRYNVFNSEDPRERNWLYDLANRFNVVTWESVVHSQLLVREGGTYDAYALAESERLLRDLPFLYDARVIPRRVCGQVVDLEVITRDIWTLNPTISLSRSGGGNSATLGITDSNVLGSGKQVGLLYDNDPDRSGYSLIYGDPALFNSRWQMHAVYSDNSDGYYRNLAVERPFFSVYEPWSAGTSATQGKLEEATWFRGDEVTEFEHRYDRVRLFGAFADDPEEGHRVGRWSLGVHYETNDFDYSDSNIPPEALPASRDYVYPFVGYQSIEDQYLKVRNMNYIGRTEDFYTGERYHWSLGWSGEAFGASRDLLALDAHYGNTLWIDEGNMWRVQAYANGYLSPDEGDFENLWFTLYTSYFHRQHHNWTFYSAARVDLTNGLTDDRQVLLGGDNGMRGYERNYQVGDRSFVINLEERYYSDWHPFRLFRLGGALFLDVGRAWYDDEDNGANDGTLVDVGVGLRLNSSRANKRRVIHVDLAFPLATGDDVDDVQLLFRVRDQF
ncbi:hypothetical protein E4634_18385 [Mangrovimicrobium sediminis]|uniref:Haemolysin activator HlyB C-terminal domain-containing protein n=1 Tax=Mangrovimicrobium sediminis TaxID=2562682 RepID=A0A4Z0LWT4_9GAMM|nr:BamA/TamA family outer membrane protein [Haliea sp. SAOS-164]TGD71607.1 hypothetical protein E4634_18385 [Haliea sp. SAOS-164]